MPARDHFAQRLLAIVLALPLLAALAQPAAADADKAKDASARDSSLSLGLDAYSDDVSQSLEQVNTGGGGRGDAEGSSEDLFAGHLALRTLFAPKIRVGGLLRYYGDYRYTIDNDRDPRSLGQLLELTGQGEYVLGITDDLDAHIGAELGLALLFPGGDLKSRLDALDAMDFSTLPGPRLGYVIGPQAGVQYRFLPWLALRGELGLLWQQLFLIDSSAERGGLEGSFSWRLDLIRLRLGAALVLLF
ncbi:MAG: hypothetical protein OEZ06_27965 [Myxococcales bacterium]|nr:hypothetical protein [Myxococcales bacterium]